MAAALLSLLPVLPAGCGGDDAQAARLVQEADALRVSVADTFRQTTAAMDSLVQGAATGHALPPNQTGDATQMAVSNLESALGVLTVRDSKLKEAQRLDLGATYQDYLTLLVQGNDKLTESISMTLEIPRLLEREQFALAGWDEIRTETVVNEIHGMQQQIQQVYADSESLRLRAEQLKKDNPGTFT
ncbi:MAG: hypothetical protein IMZ73_12365 [Chloroflexi bacterium]|nr:hypothetical protein [Chloroflexota bacterium]